MQRPCVLTYREVGKRRGTRSGLGGSELFLLHKRLEMKQDTDQKLDIQVPNAVEENIIKVLGPSLSICVLSLV